MGACCFPGNNIIYRIDTIPNQRPSTALLTEMKEEETFTDMTEIEDKYKGIGIKKMKAYKCDLNIDDLISLRDHFWEVKIMINDRWKILRQACLYDSNKCADYLSKNGFWTVNGCLNECSDYSKNIYRIPNYCINDPLFEKELIPIDHNNNAHKGMIHVILSENDQRTAFDLIKCTSGKEVKIKYCAKKGINIDDYHIRLFFGGNEIKDDQLLYQHKVLNNYIIHINLMKINVSD